ncbi:hypothetical protein [uncultured Corynebacterium sp.]|uniref:hypothetical protein n=1 Tax=uncultured Corynebacterium sp. TaxID=159447 RepID=UPI0025DBE936|nr:hypothetical protein [uncultured Corynebacterium sp.]
MTSKTGFAVMAVSAVSALALAGCQQTPPEEEADEGAAVGNATPADSPAATDPDGEVLELPREVAQVTDMAATSVTIAVRSADHLAVGDAAAFQDGSAAVVEIPTDCGQLTAADNEFLLGCGTEVLSFDSARPEQPEKIAVDEEFSVTAAARTSSGELFVASDQVTDVAIYKDGERSDSFAVEDATDQLLAVPNQDGTDNVVRTLRADSTIQSLDWERSRAGGRLRVGVGLGQASVGDNGTIVVSDTLGERVAIYNAEDVIRLHQYGNTDGVPWATAWDDSRQLAWVTTTDNNQAQTFEISHGVPEERAKVSTVANAQNMVALSDGTIAIASATGDGLQIIKDI